MEPKEALAQQWERLRDHVRRYITFPETGMDLPGDVRAEAQRIVNALNDRAKQARAG